MSVAKRKSSEIPSIAAPKVRKSDYQLTKSKYCTGIQCSKALYLTVHHNELATPPDESQQQRFDYGKQVGVAAQKYYPNGLLIKADHFHRDEAVAETKKAICNEASAIFEAAFFWEKILVRVDILRNNLDGTWDLIEVKSSTSVKDEHIPDMAIQRYVVEKSGIKVRSSILKHINKECVSPNFHNLFTDIDCTDSVLIEMQKTSDYLKQMFLVLEDSNIPSTKIGSQCDAPYECAFKAQCWKNIPEYSVFELSGVWNSTKFQLFDRGIVRIADIPDGEKVSRSKAEQIQSVKSGKAIINKKGIQEWLCQLSYPLYFIDFETINPPIPIFPGTRPYQQVPFQFSCHIQMNPNGPITQIEFLANDREDPRHELAISLIDALGRLGSIIAYNARFEKSVIEHLADTSLELRNDLLAVLPRFVDLLDIFKKYYFHPDFKGSNSIKATLPVLVPEMTYDQLNVHNGIMAQMQYEQMILPTTSTVAIEEIRANLLQYCGQDTLAMVKLLQILQSQMGIV